MTVKLAVDDSLHLVEASESVKRRSKALFLEMETNLWKRTDKLFSYLLIFEWIFGIGCAFLISPYAWAGSTSEIHTHVWAAIFLGGAITLFPAALARINPGKASTRHIIAIAQMLHSALLIHLMGGRIETHFHIFGSLAFLAFYRDWKVLVTASVVVALDHFFRGVFWPQSVYGIAVVEKWRWLEHTAWVLFEDLFLGYACITGTRDMKAISARRAILEESNVQIQELRRVAEDANRAKSAFLANMSHEIRTPLGAILGFAPILADAKLDPAVKDHYVDIISRNGDALTRLIDDILDLSKIEANRLEIEKAPFSLSSLLDDVQSSLNAKTSAKGLAMTLKCQVGLPDRIITDQIRLRQILLNVIGNAVKFTEAGSVHVDVSGDVGRSAVQLAFKVKDTGRGIGQEEQERLFQPFTQADPSTTRRYGGTGLGLVLSKNLARKIDGDLFLTESTPGKGSTFVLMVTCDIDTLRAPVSEPSKVKPTAVTKPAQKTLAGVKVLVADDALDNQALIRHLLKASGAETKFVDNGSDAVAAAMSDDFDVILMDIQMPVMDGLQATQSLRSLGYAKPIIALTAHAMQEDRERCLDAGCNDHLAKPINRIALIRAVADAAAGDIAAPGSHRATQSTTL